MQGSGAPRNETVEARESIGKAARARRSRGSLAEYTPREGRPSPIHTLAIQETDRVSGLLPLRHERMGANPFAFLRGAAAVMAGDLGSMPNTGLTVQLCGDAHLSNFGLFAGPDRALVFDLNDFDETHPGPFEWDVMRLSSSLVVAAQVAGRPVKFAENLPMVCARAYRKSMAMFAGMTDLDVWYYRIDTNMLERWAQELGSRAGVKALHRTANAAAKKDRWSAVRSLTEIVNGHRAFKHEPPLLVSLSGDARAHLTVSEMYQEYRASLLVDRSHLLGRYHWIDAGHKVVGVGSVGLLAFVLLLEGRDAEDVFVLQLKEAVASVLEPYTEPSVYATHGERVVAGQRIMQASTDAFLGYVQGPRGRSYYGRQLRDMKWAPDPLRMNQKQYLAYAELCGLALARAHARSGDSVAINAYLGTSEQFERSMQAFGRAYARQTQSDFEEYQEAIAAGTVGTLSGPQDDLRISLKSADDGSTQVEAKFVTADT